MILNPTASTGNFYIAALAFIGAALVFIYLVVLILSAAEKIMRQTMKKVTCNQCGKCYRMGRNGTVDGCDSCTGIIRDKDGYIYEPGEEFITLEDIETGEQEVRQRPIVGQV